MKHDMTIHKPYPDILIKNMTDHQVRIMKDFEENRQHTGGCVCWLCLWRRYQKIKKKPGHPFDYLTFLVYDILSTVEAFPFCDEDKMGFSDSALTNEVIRGLAIFSPETKQYLIDMHHIIEGRVGSYLKKKRYGRSGFIALAEDLRDGIVADWFKKTKPAAIIDSRHSFGHFAQRVAEYIRSRPDRKTTQWELLRHFSDKHVTDFEGLREWLQFAHGIETKTEGRTIVYWAAKDRGIARRPR